MTGERKRRPASLDDVLLLIGRRLLLPLALSVATIAAAVFLLLGGLSPAEFAVFRFGLVLAPLAGAIAAGLVFIGLPAGYIVARFGLGFGRSLAVLALVGFAALFLPLTGLTAAFSGGVRDLAAGLVGGVFGALVSAIWTVVNRDLFRPREGA
ncbi:MAG TPA: hypothetical protein VGB08_00795 [Allosphingosinicella sp.]|jgi:hypothetical protein